MKPVDIRKRFALLAAFWLALLGTACQSPSDPALRPPPLPGGPTPGTEAAVTRRAADAASPSVRTNDDYRNDQSPIDYLAGLARLDANAAQLELERLETRILWLGDAGDCSVACTRLALLLSVGVAEVPRNLPRALGLLERALASRSGGMLEQSYLLFAKLWQQHLDALSRIDGLASRIDEQKHLIDALRMQIEELTALEQRLIKREEELQP